MNIALNKISGDWDQQKLEVILEEIELSDIDVKLTGFEEIILEEIPDFQPVDDDGTRLDIQDTFRLILIFDNEFERDKARDDLSNEGYNCKLN